MADTGIGASVKRKEDFRFLTGRGTYTDDINRPGQTYAYILRSPHAPAKIKKIDTRQGQAGARASSPSSPAPTTRPTARAGCPAAGRSTARTARPWSSRRIPPLVADLVRHVGDQVAVVIAETRAQARDAAELIEVDYEELKPAVDTADALKPDAPAGLAPGQGQPLLRLASRRQGGRRRGLRQGRPCHQDRPGQPAPDRQCHGAARRDRRIRPRDGRLHALHHQPESACHPAADGRLRPADPGEQAARRRARMWAAASAPRSSTMPKRRSSPGPPARSAGPSNGPPIAANPSCRMRKAATMSAMPSWPWTRTASSWPSGSAPSPIWAPISRPSRPACRPISTARCWPASMRRPAIYVEVKAVFTNTVAGRCLSRRRAAGSHLPAGAAGRQGGPRDEDGPARHPPEELHPAPMPSPIRRRSLCSTTAATITARWTSPLKKADCGRLREAPRRGEEPRQAARHRHLDLSRGLRHRALGGGGIARRPRRALRVRPASAFIRPAR